VDLPALGFTSLRVVPSDTPVRRCGSLRTGPRRAENEHLAIEIQPGGTLSFTDKSTGEEYTDLLMLEDRSEVGDGWFHGHSINDEQFLSAASEAQVSVVDDGPEQVTFRSTVWLTVPERYDWRAEQPSEQTTKLKVSHLITLRRGARVIDVQTVVENAAEDHRLRLLLPTDCEKANTWLAHTPYHVTEREIALDPETTNWQEMEQAEKPFRGFQAVGSKRRGLAFISEGGLHEGGVMEDRRRTMQVTLLRSFRTTVGTDGERDGLERGRREYRYALLPYSGSLPETEVIAEMDRLQSGLLTRQSGPRPSGYPPLGEDGTDRLSFLRRMDETLAVSAIKPRRNGEGLVIRLWNPANETRQETLRFFRPVAEATKLKLSEETVSDQAAVDFDGQEVTVQAAPWKIVTVGVKLG
jgi:alpha-mannosidase